ncbi:pilus assembly PilX family protein [Leeia oryzae]|uniref:pilus assembly PilX family protein n=1 Tax=Leeia oryzae TaxID=356662 RepID=UPI00037C9C6B|nr:hypothetical protein [Leeia oryzae]
MRQALVLTQAGQKGATLLVGLIMLVVITLLLTSAYTLSNTNLRAVGNMQFRQEAVAAANTAIEQVISSNFLVSPVSQTIGVDINNDGAEEYSVVLATPVCSQVKSFTADTEGDETSKLAPGFTTSPTYYWSLWDLRATVTDNVSGTSIVVHQGIRAKLTETQYNSSVCV